MFCSLLITVAMAHKLVFMGIHLYIFMENKFLYIFDSLF